jgi:sarcosine reductase
VREVSTLDLATFEVRDVVLGRETRLSGGVLSINVAELKARLLEGNDFFEDIGVDVVRPGQPVRVIHVIDVVEPRVRVSEPRTDFPGMLGGPRTVGMGRTHRLNGVAVMEVAEPLPGEPTSWREAIVDMAGEGTKYSPFSQLTNVVLSFQPKRERLRAAEPVEHPQTGTPGAVGRAMRIAGLTAAVYLAEVTKGLEPDRVETYALDGQQHCLPGVAYVFQMQTPFVYGEVAHRGGAVAGVAPLPTIIHPNEILDGAIVNAFSNEVGCMRGLTYLMQNHRLIRELYAGHGRELDFRGVVLYTNGDSVKAKERISSYAANLVTLLGADGAILNPQGGGHGIVDMMLTCGKLEKRGVKTTLLLMEMAVNPGDSGYLHFVREADAIVSAGNYEQRIDLAPMPKVLGGARILELDQEAAGSLNVPLHFILAATDRFGSGTLRGRSY